MYKNVLITTSNSLYYESLLTLINGVHVYGLECVDKIFVFDLGLDKSEVETINKLKLVEVLKYPNECKNMHPKFFEPKSHVYKIFCLEYASSLGQNVFWLDAGATPINNMCKIYKLIEDDEIFMVVDVHLTGDYTHSDCKRIMKATEIELNDRILSSGIFGYKSNGKYRKLISESFEFSKIEGCIDGDQENHRHDQSILSIMATRYNCPKQDIDVYGYWTDINRNLQTAIQNNAIIFVHRRGYTNKKNLIYEN